MIPVSALLLAVQACAQIKGSLPDAPLPDLPGIPVAEPSAVGSQAPLPELGAPLPLAPLSELPAHQTTLAAPAVQNVETVPGRAVPAAAAAATRTEVASELRSVRIDQASAGDARALGDRLMAVLVRGAAAPGLPAAPDDDEVVPLPSAAPSPASTGGLLSRIGDLKLRSDLEQKIYQDPLTRLPKRSWLEDRLEEVVARKSVVMIIDLDHFKTKVNDAHGHAVGDIALRELAAILRSLSTRTRVSARWGGEEFVIVDESSPADALRNAERLRSYVEQRLGPSVRKAARTMLGKDLPIPDLTISIGVAPIVRGESSPHGAWIASLAMADRLLYEAKAGGRNQVKWADTETWSRARNERPWLSRGPSRLVSLIKRESVLSGRIRWADGKTQRSVEQLLKRVTDPRLRTDLERRIYTDPLTGAYNRAHLNDHLYQLVAANGSIVAFDVDFFKKVNDSYGHSKGDEVLAAFAAAMKRRFGEPVYRMGGEEFLALVPEGRLDAYALAETFRAEVERTLGPSVGLPHVTVSVGVSAIPSAGEPARRFAAGVESADEALYRSKHTGRNRVTLAP
jgi:diguanylate cyclase (GGDEF)-like protein